MSAVLPEPVPLDLPDEEPSSLSDVVAAVTGAAFRFGVLEAHLAGPAATAPGWLGQDARAAAAQVGVTATLVRDVHGALTGAVERLGRHAELLDEVRSRIAALRRHQEDDYGAAAARLAAAALHPATPGGPTQPALIVALGDELRSAESVRQRQHEALLADLRTDALDTARTLAAATAVVGGTGRSGDANRVVAHLAVQLPGWGDGELSARGAASAAALTGPATLDQMAALARRDALFAGIPAYADALLRCLGPSGVRYLLTTLGQEQEAGDGPLAGLLAAALGAARPTGSLVDPVAEVLAARYVQADDPDGSEDVVVLGMGAVLAAGAGRAGAPGPTTVATWGAQMLERERVQGRSSLEAVPSSAAPDPVEQVLAVLHQAGDPDAAALLLAHPGAWAALLARTWEDDALMLSQVVELVQGAGADAGAGALSAGLTALSSGLSRAGAEAWTVRPETAAAIAPSLGRLAAEHLDVVTGLLQVGVPDAARDAVLRGLGYLLVDPDAASTLTSALMSWAGGIPAGAPPSTVDAAADAFGALLAVRQYGQRLTHAVEAAQALDAAVDRQVDFEFASLPLQGVLLAVDGVAAVVAAGVTPALAQAVHADGSWSVGPDHGLAFDRNDAGATAATAFRSAGTDRSAAAAARARAAFDSTLAAVGRPSALVPDDWGDSANQQAADGMPSPVRKLLVAALDLLRR